MRAIILAFVCGLALAATSGSAGPDQGVPGRTAQLLATSRASGPSLRLEVASLSLAGSVGLLALGCLRFIGAAGLERGGADRCQWTKTRSGLENFDQAAARPSPIR
jgi:hypothetical protein